jgi:preprotein translocase subunit SecY
MQNFLNKIKIIFGDAGLRKKIFFVLLFLIAFRLGANIPIPGVDPIRLSNFLSGNQFFGMLNIFSGGGLSKLSIMMLGVGPYITSSIIMQLLGMIFPRLKEMQQEEGEAGRQKINQYSRLLTVPLAALQGFALLTLLEKSGVLLNLSLFNKIADLVIVIAGSMLLMWMGELITEYGIGNGVSLLIFAGIVSAIPNSVRQLAVSYDPSQIPMLIIFAIVGVLIIAGVV